MSKLGHNRTMTLSETETEAFTKDWNEGVSYSKMARKYDCHTETIHAIAERLELEPRKKRVYIQGAPPVLDEEDGAWVRSRITGIMKWVPNRKPDA